MGKSFEKMRSEGGFGLVFWAGRGERLRFMGI